MRISLWFNQGRKEAYQSRGLINLGLVGSSSVATRVGMASHHDQVPAMAEESDGEL